MTGEEVMLLKQDAVWVGIGSDTSGWIIMILKACPDYLGEEEHFRAIREPKSVMEELNTLEKALGVMVCTFQRYCRREAGKQTLSQGGMKELLENELPSLQMLQIKGKVMEELLALLDKNRDNRVDFQEYIRFVASACTFFHAFFGDSPGVPPRVLADRGRSQDPSVPGVCSEAMHESQGEDVEGFNASEKDKTENP